jgi:hypothetical protein
VGVEKTTTTTTTTKKKKKKKKKKPPSPIGAAIPVTVVLRELV